MPPLSLTRSSAVRVAAAGLGIVALTGATAGATVAEAQPVDPATTAGPVLTPAATGPVTPLYEAAVEDAAAQRAAEQAAARAQAAAAQQAAQAKVAAQAKAAQAKAVADRTARAKAATRTKARGVGWVAPITSYRMSAGFGSGGSLWSSGRHTGQDFAAPSGTPVRAAAAGTVISAGWSGAYGKRVEIRHADGTVTSYSHLSRIVATGGSVGAGERIGSVGSTGNSTGPHLHFEVERGGSLVNPLKFLRAHGVGV